MMVVCCVCNKRHIPLKWQQPAVHGSGQWGSAGEEQLSTIGKSIITKTLLLLPGSLCSSKVNAS